MRQATIERNTLETQIRLSVNLDGDGKSDLSTGVPFLEHMLDQIARHGLIDLTIDAKGDTHIDDHHTVEDIGISLGMALREAVGTKKALNVTVTLTCRWTRLCLASSSTCPGAPA